MVVIFSNKLPIVVKQFNSEFTRNLAELSAKLRPSFVRSTDWRCCLDQLYSFSPDLSPAWSSYTQLVELFQLRSLEYLKSARKDVNSSQSRPTTPAKPNTLFISKSNSILLSQELSLKSARAPSRDLMRRLRQFVLAIQGERIAILSP